jgi:hypothetical protein
MEGDGAMRAIAVVGVICAAGLVAGCATLSYEGMPSEGEPYAMAVEEGGVNFVSVDGREVERPAFSTPKLRLAPGRHEIVARFDESRTDTDYVGDLQIEITVHYWSRFAHAIGFAADEGYRYTIGAEAKVPTTEVSYEASGSELPPDHPDAKEGRVRVSVDHELTEPDDWRPVILHMLPIKKYWRTHPLPTAQIRGTAMPDGKPGPVGD